MLIQDWPDLVRSAGIEVEIMDGFATRSHGEFPDDVHIVWHEDSSPEGASQTTQFFAQYWDTSSPNIWVDYAGKWWFFGAGQAHHLGSSVPAGSVVQDTNSVAISTDHRKGEAWPPALLESLERGTAAIMKAKALNPDDHLHFNKTVSPEKKKDPDGLDITQERKIVSGLTGTIVATTPNVQNGAFGTGTIDDTFKQGVFNYLYMGNQIDPLSSAFDGDLAPVNDQQLIGTVQAIVAASLRSFMSGPDGSFIAFYPDYFGLYGGEDNYKLVLEDIELVDFKIDVNDDELTTDVFVTGENASTTGTESITQAQWVQSNGVVNIRQASAMALILGDEFADKENFDPEAIYNRFGLRPLKATFQSIHSHLLEYLQALTLFQRKWAAQYRTQVQFTFMPELYPGMRILIKSAGITVFVEEVVHTGSFETGFSTSATISSPAAIGGGGIKGLTIGKV